MQGRKRQYPENNEQSALVEWFYVQFPNELIIKITNEGIRTMPQKMRWLKQGGLPGAPDLFMPRANSKYYGLFIEMKPAKGGKAKENQKIIIERLNQAGFLAIICHGFDAAKIQIENYLRNKNV